ncbi:MAG: hydroxyacylglutathione hydrolase [Wenzhouxiangellaceae bacterium]
MITVAIPAFTDNYIWALHDGRNCVLVDPGDARPALEFLHEQHLVLTGILLTHHHADHIGGVAGVLEHHRAPVWGPHDPRMPPGTNAVGDGDRITIAQPALQFEVIETPGHTLTHIVFHSPGQLYCGDTLFSAGCGRLFEGTPEQMHGSLQRLAALPPQTRVYCAHEYTLANCRFALAVEPDNPDLHQRISEVRRLRASGLSSLPATIGGEQRYNPFLRCDVETVVEAASRHAGRSLESPVEVFAELRRWKDHF